MFVAVIVAVGLALGAAKGAPKPPPRAPARPLVAVVAFKGLVADEERAVLEQKIRAFLPGLDVEVQEQERTLAAQGDLKDLGLCADAGSVDCLVQVGALAKARTVLAGVVSPADTGTQLELVAIDVKAMRERGRVKVLVPKDDETGSAEAIESAVIGVMRPEAWLGTLRVAVAQRGASIYVDGAPRGFAPLSESIELTPGSHAVFVALEGFAAFKGNVEVLYNKEAALELLLVPGVTEPPPRFSTEVTKADAPPAPVAAAPPSKALLRVVVYDIDAVGVEPRVAHVIGQLLVAEIRKHERVSVLDSSELRALVGNGTSTAVDARNCSAAECFAEVADALGADVVVVSNLTNIEGQVLFGLRRVDPRKQEVAGSFLERVPADDTGALLPLVGKSISHTFAEMPLRAGQTAGVDERAQLILNPPPLPPLLSGSLYAGAAVSALTSVALLTTASIVWVTYGPLLRASSAKGQGDNEDPEETLALAPMQNTWNISIVGSGVAVGAAAILGVAAVATGAFTDWEGYGAADGDAR